MGFFSESRDRMEKSRRARDYTRRAKEKLEVKLNKFNRQMQKLERYERDAYNALVNYRDYRKEIITELENNLEQITKEINKLNINTKIASLPNLKNISSRLSMTTGTEKFSLLMQKEYNGLRPSEYQLNDYSSADEFYSARSQYDMVSYAYSTDLIDVSKDKLYSLELRAGEDKRTIEILMNKLRNMIAEVKNHLYKDKWNQEVTNYLNNIYDIVNHLVNLFSTEFLVDSLHIGTSYQKEFERIQKINEELPVNPSMKDSNTLKVLQNIMMY